MAKPFLTHDQQLDKLIHEKKLYISDRDKAKEILKNIGYFALIGGYKAPFINLMSRVYEKNTSFEDIYSLYLFDQALRELVFKYLCEIEQKMRQIISYSFCNIYKENQSAYLTPANYNNTPKNTQAIKRLISILEYHANCNTQHAYLLHQRRLYHNVPFWILINALTFGQLSKLYTLLPSKIQSNICKELNHVNEHNLKQYLKILTLFRNVCAHNERLFSFQTQIDFPDTLLHKKMNIVKTGNQYSLGKRDLFGLVIAFRYLLPPHSFLEFKHSLKKVILRYTRKSNRISHLSLLTLMGFPANWETITRYQP